MKLKDLYEKMDTREREALAKKAGINAGYLYQIANRWEGKRPSLQLMQRLAASDRRLKIADMVSEFSTPAKEIKRAQMEAKEVAHA